MIYYKHYIGDYQRHTGHLSLSQDGAYRRMMDHYYSTEEALPASLDVLYRICGAMEKKEREAVAFVAKEFFTESAGHLHHQRIDEEVSIAQEKIANLKANAQAGGKQSGKSRATKSEANGEANASANAQAETNNKSVVNSQTKANALEKTRAQLVVALPDWLPEDLWADWVQYRKSIKAVMSQKAAELSIAKLDSLRRAGHDPRQVIDQTIMSGKWTGLFPIKPDFQARASPGYQTANDKAKSLADRLTGRTKNEQPYTIIDISEAAA